MKVVFLGLSITSSWGNGHATNYRALVGELHRRGHDVLFCERDVPWYRAHRDLPTLPNGTLLLYESLEQLRGEANVHVRHADLVVLGSFVPDGRAVADWMLRTAAGVTAFYDIDTPVTLGKLERGECDYVELEQIPRFDLYLSFTGGPTLARLEHELGARRALAFYCLVDERSYRPVPAEPPWDIGYLGTYSDDRQATLDALLLESARSRPELRCVVAGPQYPDSIRWPPNVERIDHVAPGEHPAFYAGQRFTLNVTRAEMCRAGWSPSVRLFEAAACGVPIISDPWPGLEHLFVDGEQILVAHSSEDVIRLLDEVGEAQRLRIASSARDRVLAEHTATRRVEQLEREVGALAQRRAAA